ncbi:MAG TPA: aspartyl protease family protein [Myxococcota bacterium]|nr:aspartyl protease family protein [Myxococcota bacterium]
MREARCALFATLLAALCSAPARAEIYQWTDADGHVHFTQQLDRVPDAQRESAMRSARPQGQPDALQTYESPASATHPSVRSARLARELRIPFVREGSLMRVDVRLNDSLTAPFYIDTGASGIALPPQLAERLGIRVGRDTPQVQVATANGLVTRPVIVLQSVELGGARVEGLEATLNPSMDVGLLGGSFFNNFVYRVDAAQSVITLAPNEGMRGGLDAEAWRARFAGLRGPLAKLDAYLASAPKLGADERSALETRRAQLQAAYQALDTEADRQRVPQAWRE